MKLLVLLGFFLGVFAIVLAITLRDNPPNSASRTNHNGFTVDIAGERLPHADGKWKVVVFDKHFFTDRKAGIWASLFARQFPATEKFDYVSPTDHTTVDDKTLVIVVGVVTPDLSLYPRDVVMGLSLEPRLFSYITPEFQTYVQRHFSSYLLGDTDQLQSPFVEHYTFLPSVPVPAKLRQFSEKSKLVSIMVSLKKEAPGHKYLYALCDAIIRARLPVDLYGTGADSFTYDGHVMGEFQSVEPYEDYQFTIAIENFREPHYFSEKITSPIIYNTVPIYLGCYNVTEYLGHQCCHTLSGNLDKDVTFLQKLCQNPEDYLLDLSQARQEIVCGKANLSHYLSKEVIPSIERKRNQPS
jgi:hypothetical protein